MHTEHTSGRRILLPVILSLTVASQARAWELAAGSNGHLNFEVNGAAGIFHSDKRYNMDGAVDAGDVSWRDA